MSFLHAVGLNSAESSADIYDRKPVGSKGKGAKRIGLVGNYSRGGKDRGSTKICLTSVGAKKKRIEVGRLVGQRSEAGRSTGEALGPTGSTEGGYTGAWQSY